MRWLILITISAVGLYLAALLFVYFAQRSFMYFPDKDGAPAGFQEHTGVTFVKVKVKVEGIGSLRSLYAPAQDDGSIILFFHGNGGSAYGRTAQYESFKTWGVGFLAVEYPGYGGNIGTPNQSDILATALANYDWLITQGYKPAQIMVYGNSLGAASATYVAANRDAAALILSAPFISMQAMSQKITPWLPTGLLLKDTYRSDHWMAGVTEPLLILHGTHDEVIPFEMGKELFGIHAAQKTFIPIKDGRHYLWNTEMPEYIRKFVEIPRS